MVGIEQKDIIGFEGKVVFEQFFAFIVGDNGAIAVVFFIDGFKGAVNNGQRWLWFNLFCLIINRLLIDSYSFTAGIDLGGALLASCAISFY